MKSHDKDAIISPDCLIFIIASAPIRKSVLLLIYPVYISY